MGQGDDAMPTELLVDKKAASFTTAVVEAAAGNEYNGKEMMRLLLQERDQKISITEAVVEAAAGNRDNGKEMMTVLLQECGQEISITEAVVKAAAGNKNRNDHHA